MTVVCLSVCPVPDPKSRMEGHSKLKIGRKEAHDPSPHLEVKRWKVKVTRPFNAVAKIQPYLRNGKAYEFELVIRIESMTRITDLRGDLKGQRSRL